MMKLKLLYPVLVFNNKDSIISVYYDERQSVSENYKQFIYKYIKQ
jgi:hypothetical protein